MAEGFCSLEEAVQEYIGLFRLLQQDGQGQAGEVFREGKEKLERREQQTGVFLPARYLREHCALTETEYWLVMLAFCCEVEEGLCLDFWSGSEGKWPTLQYALHLLSPVLSVDFELIAELCRERGRLADLLQLRSQREGEAMESGLLSTPLLLRRRAFYFLLTGEPSEQTGEVRLGRLVETHHTLDELVLPRECRAQLETVMRLAKGWTGEGLLLLFHGSSGTGKTMAASALAGYLERSLLKVDLSRIYDKYIGETEKHLDEIFEEAQKSRYLLFFDEADALFARRTGIQDSHDKYANLSTAYLLQRIEEYDGIIILATNLLDHFDDAFVRRIRFIIKFRNLDEDGRRQLWEKALEGTPPAAEDVSCEELAQAAALSPARIQSAAQVARQLAVCGESKSVTREHLRSALELEAGKDETTVRMSG